MDEDQRDTTSPVNSQRDDTKDSGLRVDPSAIALGSVFGPVAFPPDMPEDVKNAIMDRLAQMRDAAGDMVIDNRMTGDTAEARHKRAEEADDDTASQYVQIAQQHQREEREREEWSRTKFTVASVAMTGAEWAAFADRLRNDEGLRRHLIDAFEAKGATHDEAVTRVDRVASVADAAATPESRRTDTQKAALRDAKTDPELRSDVQTANSFANGYAEPKHSPSSLSGRFETATADQAGAPEPQAATTSVPRPVIAVAPGAAF